VRDVSSLRQEEPASHRVTALLDVVVSAHRDEAVIRGSGHTEAGDRPSAAFAGDNGRVSTRWDWDGVRLHVVTGKGGTGKTTVAAALALALADQGQRVLLCEVEGRQGLARLFDATWPPYVEGRLAGGARGGELFGLAIDPEAALLEYLEMYYHLGRAGRALDKVGAIDFITTIAPGMRDVLLTGKVYEATRRKEKAERGERGDAGERGNRGDRRDTADRRGQRRIYDAVVLDAPPTGRIVRFLGVNVGVADLARVGPIRNQADSIMRLLRSPQTAVHVVTLLEEMPVQETADGLAQLREAGLPAGGVVVNFVRPAPLGQEELAAAVNAPTAAPELAKAFAAAGLSLDDDTVGDLVGQTREYVTRLRLEEEQRAVVDKLGRPTYELPQLAEGIDLGALRELARLLTEQGMA